MNVKIKNSEKFAFKSKIIRNSYLASQFDVFPIKCIVLFQQSHDLHDDATPDKSCNEKLRARFAALAADVENFEYDMKSMRPKETFLKGPSPRLSGGDVI